MVKQIRKTGKEANARGKMWISIEDRNRVRREGVGLQDYWLDCWETDPFGNRWTLMCSGEEAATDIKSTTKAKYRKQLKAMGLFIFEERKDGKDKSLWVRNLRGCKAFDQIEQVLDGNERSLDRNEKTLDQIERKKAETLAGKGAESSSISFQNHLNISSTAGIEESKIEQSSVAAISFDYEEHNKIAEPENLSNNSTPVSGELSVKPQDPVASASSYDSNPDNLVSCLDVELSSGEKSSARAATQIAPKYATLISEFSDWLTQKGRADCVKDLAGLRLVIQGADEAVLTDAIAHVKEKIDGLKNFGGYFRRALENEWKPQQAIAPIVSNARPTGLQPLDKSGLLSLDNGSIEARLPRPTGYCDSFQKSVFELGNTLKQRGLSMPGYWIGDVWGMRGQLSPIAKYYESRNLDFTPVQPHLASEYVILESDKLPVICFLDTQTGNYELVVISGR